MLGPRAHPQTDVKTYPQTDVTSFPITNPRFPIHTSTQRGHVSLELGLLARQRPALADGALQLERHHRHRGNEPLRDRYCDECNNSEPSTTT